MAAEKQELSILEQLKQQHAAFVAQREQAQNNYNQLVGAIFACELMIKKHETEKQKGAEDVKIDNEGKEQAA